MKKVESRGCPWVEEWDGRGGCLKGNFHLFTMYLCIAWILLLSAFMYYLYHFKK